MTSAVERIMKMPLKADDVFVRGAADSYHVATISSGMNNREDYARLFAAAPSLVATLRTLSDGIAEMRQRVVISDERDTQWLDATLARARAVVEAAMPE